MEVAKEPYGISNFVEVVEQNQYYVDKTMYLPCWKSNPVICFSSEFRRFGKSIFLSMLRPIMILPQREVSKTFRQFVDRESIPPFTRNISSTLFGFHVPVAAVVHYQRTLTGIAVW